MLIHELLNKDPDIVPDESPLIILNIKYAVCMANNVKDTNRTRNISRRVHFVRNYEKRKTRKIEWFEGGLKLADISTNTVGEPVLIPRMKYIMVRLDN